MKFHLFIFSFIVCNVGVISKKLPRPAFQGVFSYVFLRNFIFLHLIFYPLIHFNFCEWCETGVQFCSFV